MNSISRRTSYVEKEEKPILYKDDVFYDKLQDGAFSEDDFHHSKQREFSLYCLLVFALFLCILVIIPINMNRK